MPQLRGKLAPPVFLTAAAIAIISGDLCGEAFWGGSLPAALLFFTVALVLSFFSLARWGIKRADSSALAAFGWRIVLGAAILHLGIAVAYCQLYPAHDIDTYTFQETSAQRLAHGNDPFGGTETNVYTPEQTARFYGKGTVVDGQVQVGLQYPPLTVLWVLPGYWVGDVRYSYIAAVVISGLLLFAIAPNRWGLGLALLLLLNPFTFIVENRCWTEPLPLALLAATVYVAQRRRPWLPVALGLLLASKQYMALAVPLAAILVTPFDWRRLVRLLGWALVTAAMIYLPFILWNFRALFHDLVLFHLDQPFRADALSFAVAIPFLLKLGPLMVLAWLVLAAWKLRGPAAFAAAFGLAVLIFFTTGKQAFTNYFFLVAGALTIAAAAWTAQPNRLETRPTP